VARKRSPARLVIALSVAAVLAVFLLYTSIAGGGVPTLRPSQLPGHHGTLTLSGVVLGPVSGDSYAAAGKRFRIRDRKGTTSVAIVYHGEVPPLFRPGREVFLNGHLANGVFVGDKGSLVTRCPSKYTAKTKKSY
jgi:cytochrome c-type biogenesis protein CcmE